MPKVRHPSSQVLLKALDGELSSRELKAVQDHLQACIKCRDETKEIDLTLRTYLEFTSKLAAPQRLTSSSSWAPFPSRLNGIAEQRRRQNHGVYFGNLLRSLFFGRVAFGFQAALVMVSACLFWVRFEKVSVVSASELLRRAAHSETAAQSGGHKTATFQKLAIRINEKLFIRTVYSDAVYHQRAAQRERLTAEVLECRRIMEQARLSFDEPLSAAKFQSWLESQKDPHRDSVAKLQNQFSLTSEFRGGIIQSTELVIRATDYHAIRERVQFADNHNLEITELAYGTQVPDGDKRPKADMVAHNAKASSILNLPDVRGAEAERKQGLERREMETRVILHRVAADLGEQITLDRVAEDELVLNGIVEDTKRKDDLLGAFKDIDGLHLHVQTVDEAATELPAASGPPTVIENNSKSGVPILASLMKEYFKSDESRQQYVRRLLSVSDLTMSRAFALRQLARRYPLELATQLPIDSQHQLSELIQDHVRKLDEEQQELRKLLVPFVELPPGTIRHHMGAWQGPADQLVGILQREHQDLITLFADKEGLEKPENEVIRDLKDAFENGCPHFMESPIGKGVPNQF